MTSKGLRNGTESGHVPENPLNSYGYGTTTDSMKESTTGLSVSEGLGKTERVYRCHKVPTPRFSQTNLDRNGTSSGHASMWTASRNMESKSGQISRPGNPSPTHHPRPSGDRSAEWIVSPRAELVCVCHLEGRTSHHHPSGLCSDGWLARRAG